MVAGDDMARAFAKQFYKSRQWQDVREYVLMRDSKLCVRCGAPAEEVHHIIHLTPDNIHDDRVALNPDNLASLCRDCHFREHAEDKINGQMRAKGLPEYEYTFDESGQLIKNPVNAEKIICPQEFL